MTTDGSVLTSPVSSSIPPHLSTRSPRSSLESSPRTPTSPFLLNLSNRFRKSSNASNLSIESDHNSNPPEPADAAAVAQSAKRFVLKVVRNDWNWPPTDPSAVAGGKGNLVEENCISNFPQREPVAWRTRFEGASDLDLDLSPVSGKRKAKRNSDPYKFESPDAIADCIQEQRHKRRRANAQESVWNGGLRNWIAQRDAWTSARVDRPTKRAFSDEDDHPLPGMEDGLHHRLSNGNKRHSHSNQSSATNGLHDGSGRCSSRVFESTDSDSTEITEDDRLEGPYLPIYPPLFPTSHTLRARIRPAAYPTIYSKVVLQSLTPNVPIPLTHMTGALVDGWKAEGVWPPQTIVEQQTYALLKRAKGAEKGESTFHKWKRERVSERKLQVEAIENGFGDELVDEEENKRGFRKSVSGAVKKVFGKHVELDTDGGLARLGLSFDDEEGMAQES